MYDLTGWTHPGGDFLIENSIGREVGRYLYGNYTFEGSGKAPHKHSPLAFRELEAHYVGEISEGESVLVEKSSKTEVISIHSDKWKFSSIKPINNTVSQVEFTNEFLNIKSFGTSLSSLGRHFKVSFNNNSSLTRLYTSAFALTEDNYNLRQNLYRYFEEVMNNKSVKFTPNEDYKKLQNTLSLFIKNYPKEKGLSALIHNLDGNQSYISERLDEAAIPTFKIEGPVGRGLELTPATSGNHVIICAGTGILPFIDLLNLFLWKNMYDLVKKTAGANKAEEMNILKIPFDSFMNDLNIKFIGAFPNEEEFLGLDIIQKLAEISSKYDKQNFNAVVKGCSDPNMISTKENFSSQEFLKKNLSLTEDKYYVVGPLRLGAEVPKALMKLGVAQEKIMLV